MRWNPFGSRQHTSTPEPVQALRFTEEGILCPQVWDAPLTELASLMRQLEDEGFAVQQGNGALVSWEDLYRLLAAPDYADSVRLLSLPPLQPWKPILSSRGGLSDHTFAILLSGWIAPDGAPLREDPVVEGAVLRTAQAVALLPQATWETLQARNRFHRRPDGKRTHDANRRAWSAIRTRAVAAGARLDDFLKRSVVLTPDKLRLTMRKGAGGVVEVVPGFDGEPPRWLELFDCLPEVQPWYEVPDGAGKVEILITPEVQTVLREIKGMTGRRLAGNRAEAFVRNPFAALGPAASQVIDPEQFEAARNAAGITFARFAALVQRDAAGRPVQTGLLIEESAEGRIRSETVLFADADQLEAFIAKLERRVAAGAQCCTWEGNELEILSDTPDQLVRLRAALADLRAVVKAAEILDLSGYSERIQEFGTERPYYSPFIAKKNQESAWTPDNIEVGLCFTPEGGQETVAIALSAAGIAVLQEATEAAKRNGNPSVQIACCPQPIPTQVAEQCLADIHAGKSAVSGGQFLSEPIKKEKRTPRQRMGLVLKPNVEQLDYEERRDQLPGLSGAAARLPVTLQPSVTLKAHQLAGVAWLQHLWSQFPIGCRGALLADDMGLGKTLQLLVFMARLLEDDPQLEPCLVVAPVSLLENWKEEVGKFFVADALPVLTLYGDDLARKRLTQQEIDAELRDFGVTRLLRRDWLGAARLVLTTYETLRDLEFSLALQPWSVIVCDEAQKIKNPDAMMTRAAKKQNARFKIACTGTPVENTLADIWCLFDFVQPGLLGVLKDFGNRYRRPIEAETDEERVRINELRALIEPQKLRRLKSEVATDLPPKTEVEDCKKLLLSHRQRELYAKAVLNYQQRRDQGHDSERPGQQLIGLIQYLKRLCADPRPPGQLGSDGESVADLLTHSPKLAWLLKTLEQIRSRGEKAILFCEFRDLQRTLKRVIHDRFRCSPDIINGDTPTAPNSRANRQQRICSFQQAPGFGVIILSPLAVGFGVNIQAANHVIHFTRTWNPAREDQATDRAYRIGQSKEVFVYCPVVVAPDFTTFDKKLDALISWKRGLADDMLNGVTDVSPADFVDLEAPDGAVVLDRAPLNAHALGVLEPQAFEAVCAILWSKTGYRVRVTPTTGDGGVDVVAIREDQGVLIQCKSSTQEAVELGWDAVKEVVAGAAAYAARHPQVIFALVAVTNRHFNATAHEQARLNHVRLIEAAELQEMLTKYPVTQGEVESYLFSGWNGC
ncbi:MAG: restriction endonuclease [Magnetococcales bacterium]|nr:restriction endonuclease [Magnetococcales bacterium]